jgi:hypothetical protein
MVVDLSWPAVMTGFISGLRFLFFVLRVDASLKAGEVSRRHTAG